MATRRAESAGSRGKASEKAVSDFLKRLGDLNSDFDWDRVYDARTAGGAFQRRTYDYEWYRPGAHGGIEVKEGKHDTRLPYKNFEIHQVAKIRKRVLAGASATVLVYHSTTGLWRLVPLGAFVVRDPATPSGSWNLDGVGSGYTSAAAALQATGDFGGLRQ